MLPNMPLRWKLQPSFSSVARHKTSQAFPHVQYGPILNYFKIRQKLAKDGCRARPALAKKSQEAEGQERTAWIALSFDLKATNDTWLISAYHSPHGSLERRTDSASAVVEGFLE